MINNKNKDTWDKVIAAGKMLLLIVMIVSVIQFSISYGNVDYDGLIEGLENIATCEIDFKDFHYSGLCVETATIYEFLGTQYNNTELDTGTAP